MSISGHKSAAIFRRYNITTIDDQRRALAGTRGMCRLSESLQLDGNGRDAATWPSRALFFGMCSMTAFDFDIAAHAPSSCVPGTDTWRTIGWVRAR